MSLGQCPHSGDTNLLYRGDLRVSADSAAGARGDVVGVTIALESNVIPPGRWSSFELILSHDPEAAELVGDPDFTDELLSLLGPAGIATLAFENVEDHPARQPAHGLFMHADFLTNYGRRFPSNLPLPVMTVYYRLLGAPGTTSYLWLGEAALSAGGSRCSYGLLHFHNELLHQWNYLSTANVHGLLTVLPGAATHPDRPPQAPDANVYPELPTPEEINLQVRVTGATAPPGARDVPVEIFTIADVEYTGVVVPVDFDERNLRLSAADVHVVSGVAVEDNNDNDLGAGPDEGHVLVFSGFGVYNRRLAAEGEPLHLATLYFDVLETAAAPVETALSVVPFTHRGTPHEPGIWVRHFNGEVEDTSWTLVSPQVILNGAFAIRPEITTFLRGDADGDLRLVISDPIVTLNFLFLSGQPPHCLDAADANDDGELNISDPIRALHFLFLGGQPLAPPFSLPGEDPTPDSMGCLYRSP
jgi:hypothetical protein